MSTTELRDLIDTEGGPCISIILPMANLSPSRRHNPLVIRKAIDAAKSIVDKKVSSQQLRQELNTRLDEQRREIGLTSPGDLNGGVGIFISQGFSTWVEFPFSVRKKIIVNDSFETRDLIYLQQFLSRYFVLAISKTTFRLFSATMDRLEEIEDGSFPVLHEDDYEYASPSPGHSYGSTLKPFEKDKGILSAMRLRSTLKKVDSLITRRLKADDDKVVIAGTRSMMTEFENISTLGDRIVGKVAGSFSKRNSSEFSHACWQTYAEHLTDESKRLADQLDDRNILDVVYGVRNVWMETRRGKGRILFVERDYLKRAYRNGDESRIELYPVKGGTLVLDVVDDIIENVYRRGGRIVFVDENLLSAYDHIALLLRYR